MPSGFVPQLVMISLRPPFLMAAPPVLVHGFVHVVITLFTGLGYRGLRVDFFRNLAT
jgi:hypothetical protein